MILDPGDWEVKPVEGEYIAWSAWRESEDCCGPTQCRKGWLTSFHIWSMDFVDRPGNMISVPSARCESEKVALENSRPTRFTLRCDALVSFLILDSHNDNRGGLTLSLRQLSVRDC